jgi:hypothetical protein
LLRYILRVGQHSNMLFLFSISVSLIPFCGFFSCFFSGDKGKNNPADLELANRRYCAQSAATDRMRCYTQLSSALCTIAVVYVGNDVNLIFGSFSGVPSAL